MNWITSFVEGAVPYLTFANAALGLYNMYQVLSDDSPGIAGMSYAEQLEVARAHDKEFRLRQNARNAYHHTGALNHPDVDLEGTV
jgi:hypothetical protein